MPRKIPFQVIEYSSADEQYPASGLHHHGPFATGWQSSRSCHYPQELIVQFECPIRLKRVQLLSHQYLIASKIEFLIGHCSLESEIDVKNAQFIRLGSSSSSSSSSSYIELSSNERTDYKARELKSIHVDADGSFLKLIIYKNYPNRLNIHNQVSIVAINLLGDDIDKLRENTDNPSELVANRSEQISIVDDLAFAMYQDPEIAAIVKNLERKKHNAVQNEDFDQARKIKQAIHELIKIGERLSRYEVEKRQAIENEEYEIAQIKKEKMELYRAETYKQLQTLNLLDIVMEGGEGTEFLRRLQESEQRFRRPVVHEQKTEPSASIKQTTQKRTQQRLQTNRSPESTVSTRVPDSPLPPVKNVQKRTSLALTSSHSLPSPEYPTKPVTPYEDKVIPALRNRNRIEMTNGDAMTTTSSNRDDHQQENNFSRVTSTIPNDDAIAELNQAEMIEANQMMNVFDKQLIGKLYHRNHAQREEALGEIYQILEKFQGDQEDARAYLRAGSFVVARMFRVDVLAIFCQSLKLFHLLMNDYVRRHSIQRQDIIASLERVLPVLLQRTGDSNARLRQKAQEAIIESASYRELKPLQFIPHQCVYPFPKTCAPRLAISRCELIEELMKVLDVKKGDHGLNVDNVSKFCAQAIEHNAGEVRELAIKILLSLYKTHGSIVKRYLPPDNDQTRRIKKYRDMFDAFDRIDGRNGKTEDKEILQALPSDRIKRPNEPTDPTKRDSQKKQHTSRDVAAKPEPKGSTSKSRTPTRFDRKTPTSVADESEFNPDNTCIFCGEKNDEFVRNGLETHYWANCPMLRRCQECNQVVEIGLYIEHLLRECAKKSKYQQCSRCTEAIGSDYETHVKLKECLEIRPNTIRCPLCHMNIREGEKAWRDHLMGSDGCVKNPRRLQAIKRIKPPQKVVTGTASTVVPSASAAPPPPPPTIQMNSLKRPKKLTTVK